ncbi:MAG: tRNA (adenosine(37)-N6)-threonylcarbamoyltransferase complex dimerization subunit type 1 TsaB [Bacteroidota bacterium]
MTVLGIETSTAVCGVAVASENERVVERSVVEAKVHSEKLLTLIHDVLAEANVRMDALNAVAVSIGPGSFTGLRIGLSSAKGLCFASGIPLITVPTFHAIAEFVQSSQGGPSGFAIALDAKRSDYYVGTYSHRNGHLRCDNPVEVLPALHLAERLRSSLATFLVTDRQEVLRTQLGDSVHFGSIQEYCRASSVARLGLKKFLAGEFADVAAAEPMYLKDFVVRMPVVAR